MRRKRHNFWSQNWQRTLSAMRGGNVAGQPLVVIGASAQVPALLVIHGSVDQVVAPGNGAEAARWWVAHAGATAGASRTVRAARCALPRDRRRLPGA